MSRLLTLPRSTPIQTFFEEIIVEELAAIPMRADATNRPAVFHIEGGGGGTWSLRNEGGATVVETGDSEEALIQFSVSSEDFKELVYGSVRDRLKEALGSAEELTSPHALKLFSMLMLTEGEAETFTQSLSGDLQIQVDDPDEMLQYTLTITFGAETPNLSAPRTQLFIAVDDWIEMVGGRVHPQQAFMQGKIRMDGDLSLPMTLMSLANNR